MITEEEYLKAQAIVNQYHEERQREYDLELEEDDPNNWGEEEDWEESREMKRAETALNCSCGAWVIGKDGKGYHVADCICGAE